MDDLIRDIQQAHRERCFWMEQRKRSDLALGAHMRTKLGWRQSLPADERKAINDEAKRLLNLGEKYVKAARKGKPLDLPPDLRQHQIIVHSVAMRGQIDEQEAVATKSMEAMAAKLPIAHAADQTRGFGLLGLAIIVGEAGDLGNYPTHSKLWKRLGIGGNPDGTRQGLVAQGLTGDARKQAWVDQAYSPRRRSRIWTLGIAIVLAGESHYERIYRDRKVYERATAEAQGLTVVPAAQIPKKRKDEFRSLGHVDARAKRYMEKKLVRDLWNAWRRAGVEVALPRGVLPSTTLPEAAD